MIQKNIICKEQFLFQATSPLASVFITLHHNITGEQPGEIPQYLPGIKDTAAVLFYSLICIIVHAIIQEYVLDVSFTSFLFIPTPKTFYTESFQETTSFQIKTGCIFHKRPTICFLCFICILEYWYWWVKKGLTVKMVIWGCM